MIRPERGHHLSDKNISLRQQRIRFAAVAITSILTGLAVLAMSLLLTHRVVIH